MAVAFRYRSKAGILSRRSGEGEAGNRPGWHKIHLPEGCLGYGYGKTVKPDYRAKYDKRRGQDCPQAKQQEKDGHDADALF